MTQENLQLNFNIGDPVQFKTDPNSKVTHCGYVQKRCFRNLIEYTGPTCDVMVQHKQDSSEYQNHGLLSTEKLLPGTQLYVYSQDRLPSVGVTRILPQNDLIRPFKWVFEKNQRFRFKTISSSVYYTLDSSNWEISSLGRACVDAKRLINAAHRLSLIVSPYNVWVVLSEEHMRLITMLPSDEPNFFTKCYYLSCC